MRARADPALTEAPHPLKAPTTHPMGLEAQGASRRHVFPDGGLETWPPLRDLERHPLASDLEKEGLPPTLGAGHPEKHPKSGREDRLALGPLFFLMVKLQKTGLLPSLRDCSTPCLPVPLPLQETPCLGVPRTLDGIHSFAHSFGAHVCCFETSFWENTRGQARAGPLPGSGPRRLCCCRRPVQPFLSACLRLTDRETEAQKGKVTCPKPLRKYAVIPRV